MTALDWIIIAFVAADGAVGLPAGPGGERACRWPGSRPARSSAAALAPLLLAEGSSSPYAPLFSLVTALMVGGAGGGRCSRRSGRASAGGCASRAPTWSTGSAARCWSRRSAWRWSGSPGRWRSRRRARASFRKDIQRSAILAQAERGAAAVGPDPERARARRPVPAASAGRRPTCRRPTGGSCATPTCGRARERRARSSARLRPRRCRAPGGSPRPGVVVTNAHVVAGRGRHDGRDRRRRRRMDAQAIVFDPHNDVAVLRVAGLGAPVAAAARRARPSASRVAILGYPENGPYRAAPGRLGRDADRDQPRTPTAAGRCARRMTSLRGRDPVRATPAGRWSTRTGGWSRRCSPRRPAAPRAASAIPPGIVDDAICGSARRPVDTGPCVR